MFEKDLLCDGAIGISRRSGAAMWSSELRREVLAAIRTDIPGLFLALRRGPILCLRLLWRNKRNTTRSVFEAAIPMRAA